MEDTHVTQPRTAGRRKFITAGAALAAGSAALVGSSAVASAGGGDPSQSQLLDEAQIKQLAINYALATDMIGRGKRAEGLALYRQTFTPDAPIQAGSSPTLIGPEAWEEYVYNALKNFSATQHLLGTQNVTLPNGGNPKTGQASSYLHATHEYSPGGNILVVLGTYYDDVVRTKDGWRISKRTLVFVSVELRTHP